MLFELTRIFIFCLFALGLALILLFAVYVISLQIKLILKRVQPMSVGLTFW